MRGFFYDFEPAPTPTLPRKRGREKRRRTLAKWRVDADKDRKEYPHLFDDGRFNYHRHYIQRSMVGRYVSILRKDTFDHPGAHPNYRISTVIWDDSVHKRVSIRSLFKEVASGGPTLQALAKKIRAAVLAEKKVRAFDPMWRNSIKPGTIEDG